MAGPPPEKVEATRKPAGIPAGQIDKSGFGNYLKDLTYLIPGVRRKTEDIVPLAGGGIRDVKSIVKSAIGEVPTRDVYGFLDPSHAGFELSNNRADRLIADLDYVLSHDSQYGPGLDTATRRQVTELAHSQDPIPNTSPLKPYVDLALKFYDEIRVLTGDDYIHPDGTVEQRYRPMEHERAFPVGSKLHGEPTPSHIPAVRPVHTEEDMHHGKDNASDDLIDSLKQYKSRAMSERKQRELSVAQEKVQEELNGMVARGQVSRDLAKNIDEQFRLSTSGLQGQNLVDRKLTTALNGVFETLGLPKVENIIGDLRAVYYNYQNFRLLNEPNQFISRGIAETLVQVIPITGNTLHVLETAIEVMVPNSDARRVSTVLTAMSGIDVARSPAVMPRGREAISNLTGWITPFNRLGTQQTVRTATIEIYAMRLREGDRPALLIRNSDSDGNPEIFLERMEEYTRRITDVVQIDTGPEAGKFVNRLMLESLQTGVPLHKLTTREAEAAFGSGNVDSTDWNSKDGKQTIEDSGLEPDEFFGRRMELDHFYPVGGELQQNAVSTIKEANYLRTSGYGINTYHRYPVTAKLAQPYGEPATRHFNRVWGDYIGDPMRRTFELGARSFDLAATTLYDFSPSGADMSLMGGTAGPLGGQPGTYPAVTPETTAMNMAATMESLKATGAAWSVLGRYMANRTALLGANSALAPYNAIVDATGNQQNRVDILSFMTLTGGNPEQTALLWYGIPAMAGVRLNAPDSNVFPQMASEFDDESGLAGTFTRWMQSVYYSGTAAESAIDLASRISNSPHPYKTAATGLMGAGRSASRFMGWMNDAPYETSSGRPYAESLGTPKAEVPLGNLRIPAGYGVEAGTLFFDLPKDKQAELMQRMPEALQRNITAELALWQTATKVLMDQAAQERMAEVIKLGEVTDTGGGTGFRLPKGTVSMSESGLGPLMPKNDPRDITGMEPTTRAMLRDTKSAYAARFPKAPTEPIKDWFDKLNQPWISVSISQLAEKHAMEDKAKNTTVSVPVDKPYTVPESRKRELANELNKWSMQMTPGVATSETVSRGYAGEKMTTPPGLVANAKPYTKDLKGDAFGYLQFYVMQYNFALKYK